ncbi:MAG: Dabb family protein [Campylobacteraceae bacterium]|nr:Dabb family protein [Campylobacteraceae bacterium]
MRGQISCLKSIEVGIDINRSDRAWDLCLITKFNSIEDLKSYASNPVHLRVIKYIKSQNILTCVVDYEI